MTLGFIGLGNLGLAMARRLLAQGLPVVAWNRSPAPLTELAKEGAHPAATPAEVMAASDLVGVCVSSDQAVEEIAFGANGLFSQSVPRARVVADFSTGSVEAARSFHTRAASHGVEWVDAPVSGGVPGATAGKLIVFAGGDAAAIVRLAPLLSAIAERVSHVGPSGSGQAIKICNQAIVACSVLTLAETVAIARRAGIDVERLPGLLMGGFADSQPLQIFGPRMATHTFTPRLGAIQLMEKDAHLAAQLAQQVGARTAMLDRALELYQEVRSASAPTLDADISALVGLFEPIS